MGRDDAKRPSEHREVTLGKGITLESLFDGYEGGRDGWRTPELEEWLNCPPIGREREAWEGGADKSSPSPGIAPAPRP